MNTARTINAVAESFLAGIRTAYPPLPPPTQAEKIEALKQLYIDGKITAVSLEIELEHLPGGIGR